MRCFALLTLGLIACWNPSPQLPDAGARADAPRAADAPGPDAGGGGDASSTDAPVTDGAGPTVDASPEDAAQPDAFPGVLDVRIDCHNDCTLIANPASIAVPAGTEFEVNWINVGDTECDVAKIDPFNQVPIIIGLEPGTSYHDSVRQWCGFFTGTFDFRISICTLPSYIPVDCDG